MEQEQELLHGTLIVPAKLKHFREFLTNILPGKLADLSVFLREIEVVEDAPVGSMARFCLVDRDGPCPVETPHGEQPQYIMRKTEMLRIFVKTTMTATRAPMRSVLFIIKLVERELLGLLERTVGERHLYLSTPEQVGRDEDLYAWVPRFPAGTVTEVSS